MLIRTLTAALAIGCLTGSGLAAAAAQAPQVEQQEEYVPIDQLPPGDQLPAAPLLIGAYVFVPLVLFLYLVSLSRRMAVVQREVERLETDLKRTGRA